MAKLAPSDLTITVVPLDELELWPGNPRLGDVGAISQSLKRWGQVKPIVVQSETMRIVAGNHVYRAAVSLGWHEIAAYVVKMTDKEARGFVAADNRTAELGNFDDDLLANMLLEITRTDTLEGTGYDQDDLDALLAKVNRPTSYGNGDPDTAKPVPEQPWVKPGQLFQIGQHRIICAAHDDEVALNRLLDSVLPDVLLVTPTSKDFRGAIVATFFGHTPEQFWFGAETDTDLPTYKGSWLVWDKRADAMDGKFGPTFELIWSKEPHRYEILRHTFVGAADGEKRGGPDFTDRPTALFMEIYERYSRFESVVCDPMAMGATALLAAERSGRIYYGAKADPAHVQALLEKWTDYSGVDFEEIT